MHQEIKIYLPSGRCVLPTCGGCAGWGNDPAGRMEAVRSCRFTLWKFKAFFVLIFIHCQGVSGIFFFSVAICIQTVCICYKQFRVRVTAIVHFVSWMMSSAMPCAKLRKEAQRPLLSVGLWVVLHIPTVSVSAQEAESAEGLFAKKRTCMFKPWLCLLTLKSQTFQRFWKGKLCQAR